jgi:AmiR/NasT family two-component response regulator
VVIVAGLTALAHLVRQVQTESRPHPEEVMALALEAVQRTRQLRSALGSRDIIGQAKGILMERYEISPGAAFSLLARLSRESNKPVVVIAKELVETRPKSGRG